MIRTFIVDDEAPARRRIRRLLLAESDISIVGETGDGSAAVQAVVRDKPDLVFLDVQMPEIDGFGVIRSLPRRCLPAIVFVTAYDEYALHAFDVHAVDYLLKPFTAIRFRTAVGRVRQRIERHTPDPGLEAFACELRDRPYKTRVTVSSGGRTLVIDLSSIDWMEAADNYIRLHVGAHEYLFRETLSNLEAQVEPGRFVRIHRSIIVAVDRIAAVHAESHGDATVVLRDSTRLDVSRTWRERLKAALGS